MISSVDNLVPAGEAGEYSTGVEHSALGSNLLGTYATATVAFLALAIILLLARRKSNIFGFDRLSEAICTLLIALALFAGQATLPQILSVFLANILAILGCSLLLVGTRMFFGQASSTRFVWLLTAAAAPTFATFVWLVPDPTTVTIIRSGLMASLLGATAWSTWKQQSRDALGSLGALSLGACSVIQTGRLIALTANLGRGQVGGTVDAIAVLITTFAAIVWVSMLLLNVYSRLVEHLGNQKQLLSDLLMIARTAGDGPVLDSALRDTIDIASTLTCASGASLLLVDESGELVRGIYHSRDTSEKFSNEDVDFLLSDGLAGWVARERQTALIDDVAQDRRWHHLEEQRDSVSSALSVPIQSGSTLAGVLTLVHEQRGWFDHDHRHLMESAAGQIALVLRNAQINDSRLQTMADQVLLNRVLEISARGQDAEEIGARAAEVIAKATRWSQVVIALQGEDGHFRFLGQKGQLEHLRLALDEGVIGRTFQSGERQFIRNVDADPDYVPHSPNVTTELAVPLIHSGQVLGVLNLESDSERSLSGQRLELAEALADAIGLGLEKVRLVRVREELTNTMVHDLRAPMVSIVGSLEVLGESNRIDDSERRMLAIGHRNATRQAALIDAILEISRLEDGALPLELGPVRMDSLITDALEFARPRAKARGLLLIADLPRQTPIVWADRTLIARVLDNLVDNAIKFSETTSDTKKSAEITVSAKGAMSGTLEIRVQDHGPGIDQTHRQRLFQKFSPGSHSARGSGLGLAFCRLAIEANGGRIWLDESQDHGAVFAFTVPLIDSRTLENPS